MSATVFNTPSGSGSAYPTEFDSSLFRITPLNQTPFEKLCGRPHQYFDVTDPNAITSSTRFIPSSPAFEDIEPESNWTKQDKADFEEYLR
jgi:hypothetical protein